MPERKEYQQLARFLQKNVAIHEDELQRVFGYFKEVKAHKNEILLACGEHSQYTYFVTSGCIRLFYLDHQGNESTRYIAFENQLITSLVSFIGGMPTQESMQAMEDSVMLAIRHEDFLGLRKEIPVWNEFYVRYIEKAYINTVSHLFTFTNLDAAKRYEMLLEKNPEIVLRLPNRIVASYLHISQETLSRLKSRMARR